MEADINDIEEVRVTHAPEDGDYASILDAVYQRVSVLGCPTSGRRIVRAGRYAKEIMISKIQVTDGPRRVHPQLSVGDAHTRPYGIMPKQCREAPPLEPSPAPGCLAHIGAQSRRTSRPSPPRSKASHRTYLTLRRGLEAMRHSQTPASQ